MIGPWGLVRSLTPLLTAAPAARIVNVSSLSALQVATGLDLGASLRAPAYSMAKYMLNALTRVLARAFAGTAILVNAVDPGDTPPIPNAATTTRTARPPRAPAASYGPPHSAQTARPAGSFATVGCSTTEPGTAESQRPRPRPGRTHDAGGSRP